MSLVHKVFSILKFYVPNTQDLVLSISGIGVGSFLLPYLAPQTPWLCGFLGYLGSRYQSGRLLPYPDPKQIALEKLVSDITDFQENYHKTH